MTKMTLLFRKIPTPYYSGGPGERFLVNLRQIT